MSPHITGTAIDMERDAEREKRPSTICRNCDRDREFYATDGKCFFEASSFTPYTLGEMVAMTLAVFNDKCDQHTHQTTTGPTSPFKDPHKSV